MPVVRTAALMLPFVLVGSALSPPVLSPLDHLTRAVEQRLDGEEGEFGVYLRVLDTGEELGINADRSFFAASCYKVPLAHMVITLALDGDIDLNQTLAYEEHDWAGGAGVLKDMEPGEELAVVDALSLAILESDNVAGNMLLRMVGYNRFKHHQALLGALDVHPEHNTSSPRDLALFLDSVLDLAAKDPGLGRFLLDLMKDSQPRDRIAAGLPPGVEAATKAGTFDGVVINDMGVVWGPYSTYILVFMAEDLPSYKDGLRISSGLSALIYHHLTRIYPPPWVYPRRVR